MSEGNKIDYIQEKVDSVAATVSSIDKDMAIQKALLEAHTKQDEQMYEEFKRMNDILQDNTNSLKQHMKRTTTLEEMAAKMDDRLNVIEVERIKDEAVKAWKSANLKLISKVAGTIVAIAGAWVYLKPFIANLLK